VVNIAEMTEKMHTYFQATIDQARGKYRDENGQLVNKNKRQIASIAGLCIDLGISKDDLFATQSGNDEEKKFFSDTLLWFELAADAMLSAHMIDNTTYNKIKELCKEKSVESENMIQVIFSNWNAPDDWEQYTELKALCDKHEITWAYAAQIIDDTMKGMVDNAASDN
jgi:hypothetical protein